MRCKNRRSYRVILVVLVVALMVPQMALAAFVKLSGTMPAFGDVAGFQISPDGQYVVYRADQDTDEVFELYSVPLAGGTPVRLNEALPPGSNVELDYRISPDSSRVVYRADQDTTGVVELYSVPIAGPAGAGVKLNGTLVANGDVVQWGSQISPDSSRVVYRADQDADEVYEVYSVPLAGPASAGVKLNETLVAGGDVATFQVSPDSSRAVYQADQDTDEVLELYSVPLVGPASAGVKLNGTLVAGGSVIQGHFQISPDSSRVVYQADQDTDKVREVYSVPIAGPAGAGVKLNETLVAGGRAGEFFQISPDSSRVVYDADQNPIDVTIEIYSVPIAGPASAGVKLNKTLVAGGSVWDVRISPDSSRVVYKADQDTDEVDELYSVPIAGPASAGVKLNETLAANGDVAAGYQISPDSSRVVYRADQDADEVYELYSVPIAGPASAGVKLNGTLVANGDVVQWGSRISPDSSRVVYQADQDADEVYEIYSVPIAGPASAGVKLNGILVANGDVSLSFQISPDSSRVVYLADQDIDDITELYVADDGQTQVGFAAATATVVEDTGSASLAVELSGAAVLSVTVDYTVTGGTATGGGVDYALPAGSLTFSPGQTSQTINVAIVDDGLDEGDETVILTLSNPRNASLGAVTSTTLTIQDIYRLYLPLVMRE